MATTSNRPAHGHVNPGNTPPARGRSGNGNGSGRSGGRRPPKRPNPVLSFLGYFFQLLFWVILVCVAAIAVTVYVTIKDAPTSVAGFENYKPTGHTLIYSSDGVELADFFAQNRENITIDQVPMDLQNATIAIEDDRFYHNNYGFDIRGIGRALWKDIRGGDAEQGGSTITQQLVRNLGIDGLTRQKSFQRKVHEIVIANDIERNYSKQQILEMYLNAVYYGSGSYGVQAASKTYFNKPVDQLDLAQCAMIAGLPQRPTGYSPYVNIHAATIRRNIVLKRMMDLGYINAAQYASAVDEPIVLAFPKAPTGTSHTYYANYFVDYVVRSLSHEYGTDFIYRGGVKVYTTLNLAMQQEAEKDIQQGVANSKYLNVSQAALVCIEPQTGYIRAMVGGSNYKDNQYNIAVDGLRQPGSSFKPVYYTAALDSGLITENSTVEDEPIDLPGANGTRWRPKNDDGVFHGLVTAKFAIAQSLNCASVRIMQMVGIGPTIRYARLMGIHSPLAPYMTLALGASGVSPLEMADVYATIDNGGACPITTAIKQITDDTGQVIENDDPKLETTGITQQACNQMSDMLREVVTGGTASASFTDNNPPDAHGKTGTTQNHLDVWFDGYTKDLVTIVWAGHPAMHSRSGHSTYGEPLAPGAWGATVTVPIWKQFMIAATGIEQQEKAREAAQAAAAKPIIVPPSQAADPTSQDAQSDASPTPTGTPSDSTQPDVNDDQTDSTDSSTPDPNATPSDNSTDDGSPVANPTDTPAMPVSTPAQTSPATIPVSDTVNATPKVRTVDNASSSPNISSSPRMVTVTVCAESGELATKWCPETINETFIQGQQPRKHCTIHRPPPGE